jgi:hypothetical protein
MESGALFNPKILKMPVLWLSLLVSLMAHLPSTVHADPSGKPALPGPFIAESGNLQASLCTRFGLFDQLLDKLISLPRFKDEFETTTAYEQRLAKLLEKPILASVYVDSILAGCDFDNFDFEYDADREIIRLKPKRSGTFNFAGTVPE